MLKLDRLSEGSRVTSRGWELPEVCLGSGVESSSSGSDDGVCCVRRTANIGLFGLLGGMTK